MKYFKPGLTKEELKKEYKLLARKYHPDVCKDKDATKIMQEINDEFDKYFVAASISYSGYSNDDMRARYEKAREERSIILTFLRRDKQNGGKSFFTFNRHGKIIADGDQWENFHGGFALCRLTKKLHIRESMFYHHEEVTEQNVDRLDAKMECPAYADMFYGIRYGGFTSESTAVMDTSIKQSKKMTMDEYGTYERIRSKQYGEFWISKETVYSNAGRSWFDLLFGGYGQKKVITWAYMLVNGQIMRCPFNLNRDYYDVIETRKGHDFGFLAFQDCTSEEFYKWHTCNDYPDFAQALEMKELYKSDDFWWISDPVVRHFARNGVIKFWQSKRNFKLRYGSFNMDEIHDYLNELSIDDAEEIQDFLDEINNDFNEHVKGMLKKGKLKIQYETSPWWMM